MKWDEELPDVSSWQPQSKNNVTLSKALEVTCQLAQIASRVDQRQKFGSISIISIRDPGLRT